MTEHRTNYTVASGADYYVEDAMTDKLDYLAPRPYLTFQVDRPEGLDEDQIDDFCAHINRAIDEALATWTPDLYAEDE